MKICYVANSRFPSERAHMIQIIQVCNAFAENGHEVTLLVTDRKTNIFSKPEDFYGVPLLFTLIKLPVIDIAGRAKHIPVSARPLFFILQRLSFLLSLRKYLKTSKFDLLYGRDEWVLLLLTYFFKQKIVWESHEAKLTFIAKKLISRIKKIVVISEGIRDFYIQHGVTSEKILVAHDAVDERFFESHISKEQARQYLKIETNKPVVMYIGGLDEWKGVDTLFEATNNQEDFDLYVIGGKKEEIILKAEKYPYVNFLGQRPYKDLPMNQQAADILVIPNTAKNKLSSEYTSPLKLFAHMTSRRPLVVSRIPSILNVVTENEVYFFEPDNPDDLKKVLNRVIHTKELSLQKIENAFKLSLQYTWKIRANIIIRFISV